MGEEVQKTLARTSEANEIRKAARADGMIPLVQAGLEKVRQGRTNLEEILRVSMV